MVDKGKELEKLKEELKAQDLKRKESLCKCSIPVGRDNMETLFEQNKLRNQGERLAEEEAHKDQQRGNVPKNPIVDNEGDRGSTQQPLPIPQDRLYELDISKIAQSQNNPYPHLVDKEVNQPVDQKPKA